MKLLPTSLLGAIPVAAASITFLAAQPSQAAILWQQTSGQIQQQNPPLWLLENYYQDGATNSGKLKAFDEEQNILLPRDVKISNPANWLQLNNLQVIRAGTRVSSHLVYAFNTIPSGMIEATATIAFDGPIIGLMGNHDLILPTNDVFFPADLRLIPSQPGSQCLAFCDLDEWHSPRDSANFVGANALQVYIKNFAAVDPLRVITLSPVPEPITILGAATATGFGAFFKRELAKRKKKDDA